MISFTKKKFPSTIKSWAIVIIVRSDETCLGNIQNFFSDEGL